MVPSGHIIETRTYFSVLLSLNRLKGNVGGRGRELSYKAT